MNDSTPNQYLEGVAVVSPLALGGEEKNQDRAHWCAFTQRASLADGTSSSPRSAAAAEYAVELCGMLHGGNTDERVRALCELLVARRFDAQHGPITIASDVPESMRAMLTEAARQQLGSAFQTTLVSADFTLINREVEAEIVQCGDSGFFAFAGDGEALLSLPSSETQSFPGATSTNAAFKVKPGDELLVKMSGLPVGTQRPLQRAGIQAGKRGRWALCRILDKIETPDDKPRSPRKVDEVPILEDSVLLVPQHLLEPLSDGQSQQYRRVRFSPTIRVLTPDEPHPASPPLHDKSAVTPVIPDHGLVGRWRHLQDRFPGDTHFVLASDGFYSCFEAPEDMFAWLQSHRAELRNARRCRSADEAAARKAP
jgi:hypothetical protein